MKAMARTMRPVPPCFAHPPARPEHDDRRTAECRRRERVVRSDADRNPGQFAAPSTPAAATTRARTAMRVRIDRPNAVRSGSGTSCTRHASATAIKRDVERAIAAVARDVAACTASASPASSARRGYPDPRVDTSGEERDPRQHNRQPRGGRRIGRSTPRSIGRSSSCTCSRSSASNSTCCG